ncbi:class D sortase [Ornithinibacillus xuwenensis]|uniref:Class D sortase n=1 Tax=Ornithinibacillus xuwenensis TaxID=3144668 RepID=A0ABU9XL30_9BACI
MKKIAIILLFFGIVLVSIGGVQLINTKKAQNQSLQEAQALLESSEKQYPSDAQSNQYDITDFNPEIGEKVGILHIPKLSEDLPIVEGTDEDELAVGVGHYKDSAFPTENDQIVLSGHRDTVFRRMGELELGDTLVVELPYGEFKYEIIQTEIVSADDKTVIRSTAPDEVLTLTTCYPFTFIGNAPDRYIITAIPTTQNSDE